MGGVGGLIKEKFGYIFKQAAVARGMAKAVDLYDKDIFVRTLHT